MWKDNGFASCSPTARACYGVARSKFAVRAVSTHRLKSKTLLTRWLISVFPPATSLLALALAGISACRPAPTERLKTIGNYEVVQGDTLWQPIGPFHLTDQNGQPFTPRQTAKKIVVADFFFATCPTICPTVKKEEIRLWQAYKNDPRVVFVSHTIDPRHDSVAVLADYAQRLGVANSNWHFVTGPQDSIFALAERYLVAARPDDTSGSGGYTHSGALALLDTRGRKRASAASLTPELLTARDAAEAQGLQLPPPVPFYDGTKPADVDRLIRDVARLLAEDFPTTVTATATAK